MTLYLPEITRRFLNLNRRLRDMAKSMPIFITELLRILKKHPHLGMDIGIREHLLSEVEDITEDGVKEMMPNMIMIDLYVRNYFRGKVVQTLVDAGVSVHCFGAGWAFLPL